MTSMELLKLLGDVSEEYITEAHGSDTRRGKPSQKVILIAAVISLFLLLVGCAAVYVIHTQEYGHWFTDFFSGNEEITADLTDHQQSILDQGLVDIRQSVTDNGYTVTLESGISDGYRALLKLRLDAPEGVILNQGKYSLNVETDIQMPDAEDGDYSASYQGGIRVEDDPNDSTVVFLEEFLFQPPSTVDFSLSDGSIWNIHVREITVYRKTPQESREVVCDGNWDFSLRFSDDAIVTNSAELMEKPVRVSAKRSLGERNFDTKVTVTSFELRTLSASVKVKKPLTGFWEGVMLDPIALVMKDGTRIPAKYRMAVFRNDEMECMYSFDRPVSIDDVAYVDYP